MLLQAKESREGFFEDLGFIDVKTVGLESNINVRHYLGWAASSEPFIVCKLILKKDNVCTVCGICLCQMFGECCLLLFL